MGAGLLVTRVAGLLRERVTAFYLGASELTDVLYSALRGSNLVQNLLGEQALSAGFIPIYSRLLAEGREREAGRFAGAILGLLIAAATVLALLGLALAPLLVGLFVPGFTRDAALVAAGLRESDRFVLAVSSVRILFPAAAVLAVSAWCLSVLNSHRRFFLSYCAPVVWNAAIIGALLFAGLRALAPVDLLQAACLGALAGSGAQLLVQLPAVCSLIVGFRLRLGGPQPEVAEALRAFAPALLGRGVVQLSSWLEFFLASFLAQPGPTAIALAQRLYTLPVGLFGGAVAAAELPELARSRGAGAPAEAGGRIERSLDGLATLVVPAMIGALVLGLPAVALVYQTGRFGRGDAALVALVLAGFALGMAPSAGSRLLQNAFYARGDTRSPARVAALRLALTVVLAIPAMAALEGVGLQRFGVASGHRLGALGIALATSVSGWWEFTVLWRRVRGHYPDLRLPRRALARALVASVLAAVAGALCWLVLPATLPVWLWAGTILAGFALIYAGAEYVLRTRPHPRT